MHHNKQGVRRRLIWLPLALLLISYHVHLSHVASHYFSPRNDNQYPANQSILFADAEGSAKLLLRAAQTPRHILDEPLDEQIEAERCKRYNLNYTGRQIRRRVFYGSLIADDSWHPISISALENYGIFHSASFVESNRTQMLYERELRFDPFSERLKVLKSGMFGPSTRVTVDYYVNENKWPRDLGREHHQRSLIIKRWKDNGMAIDDIGYLADVDEIFTRDFIRAMQICEVRQFQHHGNCKNPKISAGALVFEGAPGCLTQRQCLHPALIIGECIEGIANSSMHPSVDRAWEGLGWLANGYTPNTQFSALPKNTTHYPLYNAADFRRSIGGAILYRKSGYHLHNFFPNIDVMRNKYKTYGHPVKQAEEIPLGDIHDDLKSMIHCGLNRTAADSKSQSALVEGGLKSLDKGSIPVAFEIPGYVEARMKELRDMLQLDKKKF
mmetsp:Transcript_10235/g.22765  ORF Transcript_10235/g.22765 Transcript_10235/m.22765 type:complete len:441 (-) Transcript_10235:228-1550(-)